MAQNVAKPHTILDYTICWSITELSTSLHQHFWVELVDACSLILSLLFFSGVAELVDHTHFSRLMFLVSLSGCAACALSIVYIMFCSDLSVWCFSCDSYLDVQAILELRPVYEVAHLLKFGERPPFRSLEVLEVSTDESGSASRA